MIAYYMRLSREQDRDDESQSIENQRLLLSEYHRKNEELGGFKEISIVPKHLEYVDDGYTGTNFDRPGWKRLIEDCKRKKVDTILVKDSSRIGRNFLEVEDYMYTIFPMLGVRLICVLQNYDSKVVLESQNVTFSNLMNQYYADDYSRKMKSSLRARWRRGMLTSRFAPYGYICEDLREGWKVDPEAGAVVKRIFAEANEGRTPAEIAAGLNRDVIAPPGVYVEDHGGPRRIKDQAMRDTLIWQANTVTRILRNEEYTGLRISNKYKTIPHSKKLVPTTEDEQFRKENDHEPLVGKEDFEKAQLMAPKRQAQGSRKKAEPNSIFTGFIFCGHCHRALARNTAFRCSVDRKVNPEKAKAISLKELEERTWNEILAKAAAAKAILAREEKAVEEDPLDARIKILRDEMFNRFTEYSDGKITKDEYIRFQNRAKAMVTDMEKRRDAEIERKEYLERRREVLGALVRTLELPELTRDALTAVVDKIFWYDGVLEVLVKGEEYLEGDEPESLVNID